MFELASDGMDDGFSDGEFKTAMICALRTPMGNQNLLEWMPCVNRHSNSKEESKGIARNQSTATEMKFVFDGYVGRFQTTEE